MKKFIISLLVCSIFILHTSISFAPNTINPINIEYWMHKEQIRLKHIQFVHEFDRFLNDLGRYESNNNWKIYNSYGYIGEWQLGKAALKDIGYNHINFKDFKKDPTIFPRSEQKKAVTKLINLNIKYLGSVIDNYKGTVINGVEITTSGLIAASHLAGAGGVKLFLVTGGNVNPTDINGTSVLTYLKVFQNYKI